MTVSTEPEIAVGGNAPAPGVVVTSAVAAPVAVVDIEKQQPPIASAAPTKASTTYASASQAPRMTMNCECIVIQPTTTHRMAIPIPTRCVTASAVGARVKR